MCFVSTVVGHLIGLLKEVDIVVIVRAIGIIQRSVFLVTLDQHGLILTPQQMSHQAIISGS